MSSTLIPAKCDAVKADVAKQLADAGSNAMFTTDAWTSTYNDTYKGVTLHYVNANFDIVNRCLAVRHAQGSHTAKLLTEHTTDILSEFGVTLEKPVNVITDNAANVKMAMTKMMVNVKWRPCSAHILQLIINIGLDNKNVTDLSKMLSKARSIVGHY